jgi:hypothetical protein
MGGNMKKVLVITLLVVFLLPTFSFAQKTVKGDVKLFQNFYKDATITNQTYIDAGLIYRKWDGLSLFDIGAQSGFRLVNNFEMNLGLAFRTASNGSSETGISDLTVGGRYQFRGIFSSATAFSAGGFMTLPIGNDAVGQGLFHFGAFAAMRHAINKGFLLTGSMGVDFWDNRSGHDASLHLAVGSIIPVNAKLSIVPELNFNTDPDYTNLTGGVDYKLKSSMRLRGGFGVGLDDGAPDFSIFASMLFFL